MPETLESVRPCVEDASDTLRRLEQRVEALESWRRSISEVTAEPLLEAPVVAPMVVQPIAAVPEAAEGEFGFDLALTGRVLLILAGAFLLRAATESGAIQLQAGIAIGLAYAVFWSVMPLRRAVDRTAAVYYAAASAFASLPLIFEATRKFHVFSGWSAALALSLVAAAMFVLVAKRQLHGVAWLFTMMVITIVPPLMWQSSSVLPFVLFLLAIGIATLWFGYIYEWRLLPWVTAAALDAVLLALSFLFLTERLPNVAAPAVIAVHCLAFAAYLASFAVRALAGHRDAAEIDIVQAFVLLLVALGGAMVVSVSRSALQVPLIVAFLLLAAISYAVAFSFVARSFASPRNFVFTSSLALMLVVVGGAALGEGTWNSVFWSALALTSAWLAARYRKSSLALHTAVYLFCGFVGAEVLSFGANALLLKVDHGWPIPSEGAILLFGVAIVAASIRPIERQGTFELWTAAKAMILAELAWIASALALSAIGARFFADGAADDASVAVARTALLALMTVAAAWACRFTTLSPVRLMANPLLVILGMKLLWVDVRVGGPGTLFLSFALIGAALIVTPRLRRRATLPRAALVHATA